MPQFEYTRRTAFAGKIDRPFEVREIESLALESKVQISEIAFAGNDAGTYSIRLRHKPTDRQFDFSDTNGAAITNTIDKLIAKIEADTDTAGVLTATNSDPELVLEFDVPGEEWEISFPSNPAGNMSVSNTQDPGASPIPLGVGVVQTAAEYCGLPVTASTDADFVGVAIRNADSAVMDYDNVTEYRAGDEVAILTKGYVWAEVEDAVSVNGSVYMRKTATAPEQAGAFRSDADGGDAIVLTGAKFKTATTGAGLALIKIDR